MTTFKSTCIAGVTALAFFSGMVSAGEVIQVNMTSTTSIIDKDSSDCEAGDAYHQICYKLPKAFDIKFVATSFDEVLPGGYTLERLIAANSDNPSWQNASAETILDSDVFFRVK
jgi:hypothetical protein